MMEIAHEGAGVKSHYKFRVFLFPLFASLAACGGGGGGGGSPRSSRSGSGGTAWRPGVFLPSANFDAMCVTPRPGTADRSGTRTDENNWLRSWTNELYLWYGEVTDRDPSLYNTATISHCSRPTPSPPSGRQRTSSTSPTTRQRGRRCRRVASGGYGAEFAILAPTPPRRIVVAYHRSRDRRRQAALARR